MQRKLKGGVKVHGKIEDVSVEETMAFYREQFKINAMKCDTHLDAQEEQPLHADLTTFSSQAVKTLMNVIEIALEDLGQPKHIDTSVFVPPKQVLPMLCFPKKVQTECPQYIFEHEERTAKRKTQFEKARMDRRLHGAPIERQIYYCDRRPTAKQQQGKLTWNSLQAKKIEMMEVRQRHVLTLVDEQQRLEVVREKRLKSSMNDGKYMDVMAAVAKERYEAADQLMRIMDDYGLVKASTSVNYWKQSIKSPFARRSMSLSSLGGFRG
ncbi:hypothetical protein AC1031_009781 [Aphanomyces cochlioides]|nr:hypothetical protein AC1031_009781 [Aphanomyces cochlioides]